MFVAVRSIGFADHVPAAHRAKVRAALETIAGLPGVAGSAVIDTLPGTFNGGHLMWRATFADEGAYRALTLGPEWNENIAPALDPAAGVWSDGAAYAPLAGSAQFSGVAGGVWRLLLVACEEGSTGAEREAMEADHMLMPRHVPEIRNWAIGRVTEATGRRRWTHVWEQEYVHIDDLNGPYLMEPIHWGVVDRWYDVECTERIVDPTVVHTFGSIVQSVMVPAASGPLADAGRLK